MNAIATKAMRCSFELSKMVFKQQDEARKRRAEGATLKELAQSYNVAAATISRLRG
jgi:hypothetical protein